MKLVRVAVVIITVFVPGYTAESAYQACLDRADQE